MPSERKQIKIAEVMPPREVGQRGAKIYEFKGEDGIKYETFSSTFAGYFVMGKTIDADVNTTTKQGQDGTTYVHHQITQIYVDGKPVNIKSGGRSYGKSPQEIVSIENQCRSKIIADLWINEKLKDDDQLVKNLKSWLPYATVADELPKPTVKNTETKASENDLLRLAKAQKDNNISNERLKSLIPAGWNIKTRQDLTKAQVDRIIEMVTPKKITEELPF